MARRITVLTVAIFALGLSVQGCVEELDLTEAGVPAFVIVRFLPDLTPGLANTEASRRIVRVQLEVREAASGALVSDDVIDVDPQGWNPSVEVRVEVPEGGSVPLVGNFRLLGESGTLEWSGHFGPVAIPDNLPEQEVPVAMGRGGLPNLEVTGLGVSPGGQELLEGDEGSLEASATGGPSSPELFWGSSDPDVLTVSEDGTVTAHRPGEAEVTVVTGRQVAVAAVTVLQRVASVEISPDPLSFTALGDEGELSEVALDPRGDEVLGRAVSWSVDDPSVLEHLGAGRFRAVGVGSSGVRAEVDGVEGTGTVSVIQEVAELQSDPESVHFVALGQERGIEVSAVDRNGFPIDEAIGVVWQANDAEVASVDDAGVVRAEGVGETTVRATAGQVTVEIEVTVEQEIVEFVITPEEVVLVAIMHTDVLEAQALDAEGHPVEGLEVSWSSSSPDVVEVDSQSGEIVALATGRSDITAHAGDHTAVVRVDVVQVPEFIEVFPESALLESFGQTLALEVEVLDATGHEIPVPEVAWTSFNSNVVRVNENGVVVAIGNGTTAIVGRSGSVSATSMITVEAQDEGVLYGLLSDLQSLAPIAGATVTLSSAAGVGSPGLAAAQAPQVLREIETGPDGAFEMLSLPPGSFDLHVSHPDYIDSASEGLVIVEREGGDRVRIDFELPPTGVTSPTGHLAGRVFDQTGEPMAEAEVGISGGALTNGVFRSVTTAPDGTYTIPGVALNAPNGQPIPEFSVIARKDGFSTRIQEGVVIPQDRAVPNVDFVLEPRGESEVFFESAFDDPEEGWEMTGFWNRTDGAGIRNTLVPDFVSLPPDDPSEGYLPEAAVGTHYAWFGQPSTGSYIGVQSSFDSPGSGGTSTGARSGTLTSPAFDLPESAADAVLEFLTWFEIEGVNPNASGFDVMDVFIIDVETQQMQLLTRLNPQVDPAVPNRQMLAFTSGGFNRVPVFRQIAVDLSAFRGKTLRIAFRFDTRDSLYNGFRGWIVDDVRVSDEGAIGPAGAVLFEGVLPSIRLCADEDCSDPERKMMPPRTPPDGG